MADVVFDLTFMEALEICFSKKDFIQGEDFEKGIYAKCTDDGVLVVCKSRDLKFQEHPLILSKGIYNQKFRVIVCAIQAEDK